MADITNVRFTASMVAVARTLATRDGMSLSAWIRRLVEQELAQRDGKCPTCRQPLQRAGGETHAV